MASNFNNSGYNDPSKGYEANRAQYTQDTGPRKEGVVERLGDAVTGHRGEGGRFHSHEGQRYPEGGEYHHTGNRTSEHVHESTGGGDNAYSGNNNEGSNMRPAGMGPQGGLNSSTYGGTQGHHPGGIGTGGDHESYRREGMPQGVPNTPGPAYYGGQQGQGTHSQDTNRLSDRDGVISGGQAGGYDNKFDGAGVGQHDGGSNFMGGMSGASGKANMGDQHGMGQGMTTGPGMGYGNREDMTHAVPAGMPSAGQPGYTGMQQQIGRAHV